MFFDLLFFGFPAAVAVCLGNVAIREANVHYWHPCFCLVAYCAYYLAGGREIMLYLTVSLLMGGGALGTAFK